MNKKELLSKIETLSSTEEITFIVDHEKVKNRFDTVENNRELRIDDISMISLHLYSWIANAVFFKGRGGGKEGLKVFREEFDKIAIGAELKEKALNTLKDFFKTKNITTMNLTEILYPLAVRELEEKNSISAQKEGKINAHIVNQATLFIRSLFQSFLINDQINPKEIRSYSLSSPIFFYRDKMIVPTPLNAFTLNGFKTIASRAIESVDENLDFVSEILVLYLSRSILASYRVR